MRKTTEQIALFDVDKLVRDGDPETSLAAATKALRASPKAVKTARTAFADGSEMIDEELWMACRKLGLTSSFAVVRHARLSLQRAGLVRDTGKRRKTSEGAEAREWVTTEKVTRKVIVFMDATTINPRRAVIAAEKKRNRYAQAIVSAYQELEERLAVADGEHEAAVAERDERRALNAQIRSSALGEAMEIVGKILGESSEKEQASG